MAKPESSRARLLSPVDRKRLPQHIAIIMDGNGRWAKQRHLPRIEGHRAGIRAVRQVVEGCAQLGIPYLTLYAFSAENWKRPPGEVKLLMGLLRHYLKKEIRELNGNNIRLGAIGRIHELSLPVQRELRATMEQTSRNSGLRLTLALNYGGRSELTDAVRAIVAEARRDGEMTRQVDEKTVNRHLYTHDLPDPDLLIRTSGEMRLSNFLLWQAAYAEIWVTETLWPDFRQPDLIRAIADYQKRERRYGGLG